MPARQTLPSGRRLAAEFTGTGVLVTVVVGSGIAAARLSPADTGLQLLENAAATTGGLFVLLLMFGPVSGAHLNPVVSLADWLLGRRTGTGLSGPAAGAYVAAQLAGAVTGTVLAHALHGVALLSWSRTQRSGAALMLSEALVTAGLVLLVFALARSGRTSAAPGAVAAYIGAGYFFTSSTAFANPAVTLARALTDTFTGIAPGSVPGFLAAQAAGLALGLLAVRAFYPGASGVADEVVVHQVSPVPAPAEGHSP